MAVELKKGQKVSLEKKQGVNLGKISVNLNWNKNEISKNKGFFSSIFNINDKIDLDLGCLFELKDGYKGCVQALGNAFGSLETEPYILLDGDDRTGAKAEGENLIVNGNKISEFKRILIYTFIYEGAANWNKTDGIVTVKSQGNDDIIVKIDEYDVSKKMCAIALLENVNNSSFSIEKVVRFFNDHMDMDRAFGWNMQWRAGRK